VRIDLDTVSDKVSRLDVFLRDKLSGSLSRSKIAEYIGKFGVDVGGVRVFKPSHKIKPGERVVLRWDVSVEDPDLVPDKSVPFEVIYDDDYILVLNKPPGVVVHPGAGVSAGTLVSGLLAKYPDIRGVGSAQRPGIVHRLDKETSGLMVVARTPEAYFKLVDMFQKRELYKEYRVAVLGNTPKMFTVSAPIGRHPVDRKKMAVVPWGRSALTHFYTLRTIKAGGYPVSILKAVLETGRTHQIRVHLNHSGYYPLGDRIYGNKISQHMAPRVFLHAIVLKFLHPITGQKMEFLAPLPDDLLEVWRSLEVRNRVHD